jgi:hypothetical protein
VLVDRAGRVLLRATSPRLPIAYERLLAPCCRPHGPRTGSYVRPRIGPRAFWCCHHRGRSGDRRGPGRRTQSTTLLEVETLLSACCSSPAHLLTSLLLGYWLAGRSLQPLGAWCASQATPMTGLTGGSRSSAVGTRSPGSGPPSTHDRAAGKAFRLHRFTAEASHELRTPLMVLRAGVSARCNPGTPRACRRWMSHWIRSTGWRN